MFNRLLLNSLTDLFYQNGWGTWLPKRFVLSMGIKNAGFAKTVTCALSLFFLSEGLALNSRSMGSIDAPTKNSTLPPEKKTDRTGSPNAVKIPLESGSTKQKFSKEAACGESVAFPQISMPLLGGVLFACWLATYVYEAYDSTRSPQPGSGQSAWHKIKRLLIFFWRSGGILENPLRKIKPLIVGAAKGSRKTRPWWPPLFSPVRPLMGRMGRRLLSTAVAPKRPPIRRDRGVIIGILGILVASIPFGGIAKSIGTALYLLAGVPGFTLCNNLSQQIKSYVLSCYKNGQEPLKKNNNKQTLLINGN